MSRKTITGLPKSGERTERKWNLAGFVVKTDQIGKGVDRWTGFDTMKEMTDFCASPGYYEYYKWPRLYELADCVGAKTDDLEGLHRPERHVEAAVRCLRMIVKKGYCAAPLEA
jgi:hypothetical protein